jgi:hypothetical protein
MLSPDNFKQLCKSRDDWHRRFESHLRQSIVAAYDRHRHFTLHGGYTKPVDEAKVESAIRKIVYELGANKAPPSQ